MNPYNDLVFFKPELNIQGFILNDRKLNYNENNNQLLFSVRVREDIADVCIVELVEQVLLSLGGGMVTKHGNLDSATKRAVDTHSETESKGNHMGDVFCMEIQSLKKNIEVPWEYIRTYLGTNQQKERVLYILMTSKIPLLTQTSVIQQQIALHATTAANAVANSLRNTSIANTMPFLLQTTSSENSEDHFDSYCNNYRFSDASVVEKHIPEINTENEGGMAGRNSTGEGNTRAPTVEELLQEPMDTFPLAVKTISRLLTLSLFQEYYTASFFGVFKNDKPVVWLQQHIQCDLAICNNSTSVNPDEEGRGLSPSSSLVTPEILVRRFFQSGEFESYHLHSRTDAYSSQLPSLLPSMIDVSFVRDLQKSFAYDLKNVLFKAGDMLDNNVLQSERSCARLMTVLKPIYTRSGVSKPTPPQSKALADYPLHLPKYLPISPPFTSDSSNNNGKATCTGLSIVDATLETASLLIYKARKHRMQTSQKYQHLLHEETSIKEDSLVLSCPSIELIYVTRHLRELLQGLYTQLQLWAKEEAMVRIRRKVLAVSQRLTSLEQYRYQLIQKLHYRTNPRMCEEEISNVDVDALKVFRSKFRFIREEEEPLLLECPSVSVHTVPVSSGKPNSSNTRTSNRIGTLYITSGHICFHSDYSFYLETLQLVLPWKFVKSIKYGDKIVFANRYEEPKQCPTQKVHGDVAVNDDNDLSPQQLIVQQQQQQEMTQQCLMAKKSDHKENTIINDANSITIIDISGNSSVITIDGNPYGVGAVVAGVTSNFSGRIFDLLTLLLEDKFFDKLMSKDSSSLRTSDDEDVNQTVDTKMEQNMKSCLKEKVITILTNEILNVHQDGEGAQMKSSGASEYIAQSIITEFEEEERKLGSSDALLEDSMKEIEEEVDLYLQSIETEDNSGASTAKVSEESPELQEMDGGPIRELSTATYSTNNIDNQETTDTCGLIGDTILSPSPPSNIAEVIPDSSSNSNENEVYASSYDFLNVGKGDFDLPSQKSTTDISLTLTSSDCCNSSNTSESNDPFVGLDVPKHLESINSLTHYDKLVHTKNTPPDDNKNSNNNKPNSSNKLHANIQAFLQKSRTTK